MPRIGTASYAAAAVTAARNDGLAFEHYCVQHHRAKYGHTVWHASVIPEADLFAAGVFHDYNSRRMLRNAALRNARTPGGITSPYVDDGIDFLVKKPDEDPTKRAAYYPGQAKNYAKKSVCANDLAGFYRNLLVMRAPGYLYTTTGLEYRLRYDLMKRPDMFTHERLDFDPTTFALTRATSHSDETTYGLRGYQKEAVCAILERLVQDEQTKMILHVGCGLGKTLIAGRVFAEIKNKRKPHLYVCIAPLRVSVTNLKDRLSPFFTAVASSSAPQFRTLLVDSDSGGTTDPVHIGNVLKTREPIVIFATYESFFGLLTEEFGEYMTDEDAFLVADEMHNLTRPQCKIVNEYQTSLLMSATVPEKMKEILDATEAYRYTMADGIKNGFLCDYEVYLPLLKRAPTPTNSEATTPTISAGSAEPDGEDEDASDDYASDGDDDEDDDGDDDADDDASDAEDDGREHTVVDMEFPAGFPTDDVTAKALFLCTGMLQTGSRRCIVYLRSTDECALFNRMLRRVSEEYHGLRLWSAQMDHTVGAARRSEMLRAFQADSDEHDLFVIASVRILDEAVDIPRCDSEFITYVGDRASDIRTVQRLQRGGRLDPTNPSKRNSLFVWTEEWSRAVNSLTLMRQEDPLFNKKLRTLSANYDRLGDPAVQRESRARAEELQVYAEVRCLTLKELFMKRVEVLCTMRERLGRDPSYASSDPEEKRQGQWLSQQRKLKKNDKLSAERFAILQAIPWWSWVAYDYSDSVAKFYAMRERLGRDPKSSSSDPEERQQAIWLMNQRQLKKNGRLSADRITMLQAIPQWSWTGHDYGDAVVKFRALRERLGRDPGNYSSDPEERRQARWLMTQRQNNKKGRLSADRISMLQAIPGWSWAAHDYGDAVAKFHTLRERLGCDPSNSSSDPEERRQARWLGTQRKLKKNEKLPADRVAILEAIPEWSWEKRRGPRKKAT
jgi:superfamily II DNA or RNA helicase